MANFFSEVSKILELMTKKLTPFLRNRKLLGNVLVKIDFLPGSTTHKFQTRLKPLLSGVERRGLRGGPPRVTPSKGVTPRGKKFINFVGKW